MPSTDHFPHIVYRDVAFRYKKDDFALKKINLEIASGEFVFLTGVTGAGKSTLLKLISRELRETSGQVLLNGQDLHRVRGYGVAKLRRHLGIVPQDFALLPRKTIWENICYAMRAVGASRREIRKRVPEILERVDIAGKSDSFPSQLSGGEQQRVAIARALINQPKIILADEPTGNLDADHSWEVMELLAKLSSDGTTVLVATHNMPVVEKLGKRVVTLKGGAIETDVRAADGAA